MSTVIKHIRSQQLVTSTWSGGTTTQLAIFPEHADYSKRDFDWRLSTATVDVDESAFTSLPGVQRFIMSLSGPFTLIHENHHEITLKPFEVDCFKGDWSTTSKGKITDFNLMIQGDYEGHLEAITIPENTVYTFSLKGNSKAEGNPFVHLALYPVEGRIVCDCLQSRHTIEVGDLMLIETSDLDSESICITNKEAFDVHVVIAKIEAK